MGIPLKYNIRNLLIRRTTTALTAFGMAMVVLIFVALAALVHGLRSAIVDTGYEDNVILLSQGALSMGGSELDRNLVQEVQYLPEIKKNSRGDPLVSMELMVSEDIFYNKLGQYFSTSVRGIKPIAFEVHDNVKIVEGRPPYWSGEIMLGKKVASQLEGIGVGKQMQMGARAWKIVGVFSAEGNTLESEIWADLDDLMVATRKKKISAIVLKLREREEVASVSGKLSDNARLRVKAVPEVQYFNQLTQDADRMLVLTLMLSTILSVGAIFGGMNTMYAAVASRVREIGTIRALGFSRLSILFSFTVEGVFLALLGGGIGCLLSLLLNGVSINMLGGGLKLLNFSFKVTPAILLRGMILSLLIGALGGILPARRAARLEVIEAIRHE